MVGGGYITLERLVEIMADAPRRLLGRSEAISVGGRANLTLVDLRSEFNVFTREFLSMGKATPLAGMRLRGEVLLTIADGRIAYEKNKL